MYLFTTANPPLLRDYPEFDSIDPASLRKAIGTEAAWSTVKDVETSGRVITWRREFSEFKAQRVMRWMLQYPIIRYADDEEVTTTITTGYTEVSKKTVATFFEASAEASFFDLVSASVKASLGITKETTRTWTNTHVEQRRRTYLGGHTYRNWILVDTVEIERAFTTQFMWGRDKHPSGDRSTPAILSSPVENILSVFSDKEPDQDAALFNANADAAELFLASHQPSSLIYSHPSNSKSPCSECDCEDFIEFGGRTFCHRKGCGHDFMSHL